VTANDRTKFATYTRDSYTGFDYADQRFYASTYGRFNTPDRSWKSVDGSNPESWNRYSYVNGDPVNGNDATGLCTVMISGITMGPGTNAAWTSEAQTLGADTAYPYQGQGKVASILSVIQQGFGPNAATTAALNAITYALGTNAGMIDIVAYSGGAGAFTAAYNELSASAQARIGIVQYLSPGANGELANIRGTTNVVQGNGIADWAATIGTQIPQGVPITDSSCSHTDLACLFRVASGVLGTMQSNGSCNVPSVFTRTYPGGMPGTGIPNPPMSMPPPSSNSGFGAGPGRGGSYIWWGGNAPEEDDDDL
jgi:RHS repeat-associated protein